MKSKNSTRVKQVGIQLNIASRPLQFIAGLSALVFVFNFTLEVLVSYGASQIHLIQMLCLIGVLSIWALIESLLILRYQDWRHFRILIFLLIAQIACVMIRFGFLIFDSQAVSSDWLALTQARDSWYYLFLVPYSLIFMGIHRSVVTLFTLNEKIHAENTETQMLQTLNALALARDNETGNHIIRTQNYIKNLALRLRKIGHYTKELNDQYIETLCKAAPLHDIGKVGIPDHILHKPGRLVGNELEVMKSHAILGETILASTYIDHGDDEGVIKIGLQIAGGHHEKWDGTGYPRGLKGQDIPLAARIMALADVYDALVSERIYKAGWSHEDALQEVASKRGSHFDPLVVDAFILEADSFIAISQQYKDS